MHLRSRKSCNLSRVFLTSVVGDGTEAVGVFAFRVLRSRHNRLVPGDQQWDIAVNKPEFHQLFISLSTNSPLSGLGETNVPVSENEGDTNPYHPGASSDQTVDSPLMAVARKLGIDRAIGFAVLSRFWQLLTGPITQLLIVFCFSEIQQGYYYAFMNLLAMQVFVELGLHVVIINVASHEWSGLRFTDNGIEGDPDKISRLVSLGRTSYRWYAVAAVLFVAVVSVLGCLFFLDLASGSTGWLATSSWMLPWLVLVGLTGLQLLLLPLTAILEGCGQLPIVNRIRFWQGVAGSLVVWACMAFGLGLWALCASAAVRLLGEFYLVSVRFQMFFIPFRKPAAGSTIDWKGEVLPLQWRMAIQGALLWLANHLALLVVLKYHGASAAGRFGMMSTILVAMQAASLSWIETRRPLFGQLIARKDYGQLDETFFRMSRISVLMLVAGTTLFTAGVWVVNQMPYWFFQKIADRLPDLLTVTLFSVGLVVMQLAQCTNIYVRAHKKDPFLLAAIVSNLSIAVLVFWLGQKYGMTGVAAGYLLGVSVVQVPLWVGIWWKTRIEWHSDGVPA